MPIWLSIIFAIIGNLPTIIKTIREILEILRRKSPAERRMARDELKMAVMQCSQDKDHGRLLVRLESLLARLRSQEKL